MEDIEQFNNFYIVKEISSNLSGVEFLKLLENSRLKSKVAITLILTNNVKRNKHVFTQSMGMIFIENMC